MAWTDRQEQVLREWCKESHTLAEQHELWAFRFALLDRLFGVGQIMSSGAASLIAVLNINQSWFARALAVLNVAATLLVALGTFFSWKLRSSMHDVASDGYETLTRDICIILGQDRDQRGEPELTLTVMSLRFAATSARAPQIPKLSASGKAVAGIMLGQVIVHPGGGVSLRDGDGTGN
jgi:hypothetical protein